MQNFKKSKIVCAKVKLDMINYNIGNAPIGYFSCPFYEKYRVGALIAMNHVTELCATRSTDPGTFCRPETIYIAQDLYKSVICIQLCNLLFQDQLDAVTSQLLSHELMMEFYNCLFGILHSPRTSILEVSFNFNF